MVFDSNAQERVSKEYAVIHPPPGYSGAPFRLLDAIIVTHTDFVIRAEKGRRGDEVASRKESGQIIRLSYPAPLLFSNTRHIFQTHHILPNGLCNHPSFLLFPAGHFRVTTLLCP